MSDHYETLEVGRDATDEEIKRAYKKQARRYHPDLNPGNDESETRFKEVGAAYEVLSDRDRRARYDRFGTDTPGAGDQFGGGGLGDIFEAFFGQGSPFGGGSGSRGGPIRGEDLEAQVDLDLEDVVFGGQREVKVHTALRCETCDGSGAEAGTKPTGCAECGGSGQVRRVRQSILGQMVTATACPSCGGVGEIIESPCTACGSQGRTLEDMTYSVEVPPGVDDGSTLRLTGRGAAGPRGGPSGDLYVHVRVRPHPTLRRDGDDLIHFLYIPFTQAALGAEFEYETLDGVESLTVPRGTEPGHEIRFRGLGVPHVRGRGRGDLRVRLMVEVPDDLDDEQDDLLRRYAELRGDAVAEKGSGLFSKIRSTFS